MGAYKELDEKLKTIREINKIRPYVRWCKMKDAIDEFYLKGELDSGTIYNRTIVLSRKKESFKLITLPVWITIVFGVLVTCALSLISFMKTGMIDPFKASTAEIFENAASKLVGESLEQATLLYNNVVSETLTKVGVLFAVIILFLFIIAFALSFILKQVYLIIQRKFDIYDYEIEVIELLLKKSESEEKNKSIKEIKYGDYICLGWNAVPEELQVSFLDYFKFLLETNFDGLEKRLEEGLEIKNFPNRSDEQLIEGIIATTPKELEKKRKDKNYYICNAICLLKMIKQVFTEDLYRALSNEGTPRIALHNYEHILKWILMDSEELCNLYSNIMKSDFKYEANIDGRYTHYMPIHQILRQSLFGQVSKHSSADMEISASIAVIRQLIEIRIRRAFGVISYIDLQGNLIPLDLSKIFEVVKQHKQEIEFPVAIENIERIYKWANMYIHSGRQELSWIPYFIETMLKELSFGKWEGNQWDVKNGISTTQSVIDDIHNELLKASARDDLKIYSCKLELTLK